MTCIVGIAKDGYVTIGGDSAGVDGRDIRTRKDPKVFRVGPAVIGFTSSFRMGQLLQFGLSLPLHDPHIDAYEYMVSVFVPAVRTLLADGGFSVKNNNHETAGVFLVGYRGRLFYVGSDFQVGEFPDGYCAVGCGEDYALGAIAACYWTLEKPSQETVIRYALNAAAEFSNGVRGPFIMLSEEPCDT